MAQAWQLAIAQQAVPSAEGTRLPVQELQTPLALQVAQLVIPQVKHWLPAKLGRRPVTHWVQTLLVAQVWQLAIVQQAAPVEDGTKLPEQELQVLAAEQVTQLAIVQAKHWLLSAVGKNPEAQEVQTVFVAQVWQLFMAQQEPPLTEGKRFVLH